MGCQDGFSGGSGGGGDFPPVAPVIVPAWFRVDSFTFEDFSTDGVEVSLASYVIPARGVLHGILITPVTQFAGVGLTSYTIECGITGTLDRFSSPLDVLAAVPGATVAQLLPLFDQVNHSATTELQVTARTTGASLAAATAGAFTLDILISVSP